MADQNESPEKQLTMTAESEKPRRSKFWFFLLLIIIIFVGTFSYGYFQLAKVNVSLAKMVTQLKDQLKTNQDEVSQLKNSVNALQADAQKSQELSTKQEQSLTDWEAAQKGDLNRWYIAEAQYLVKLANDHLQFTQNISLALTLLNRAEQVLQKSDDPNLLEVRKSLATDIANLQATPQVDITTLYLKLYALNNQVDQLSLPTTPLQSDKKEIAPLPAATPWWKAGLENTWQGLKKIVIVHYDGSNKMPLVMPEEKVFLYQNLHAQLENAMWGILHRNNEVYQNSLTLAKSWIGTYFVQDAEVTKSFLQTLDELQKTNVEASSANLANTIKLFDEFFANAQKGQAQGA